ncbi:hypothetical protein A6R68_19928, partial [Neotoma lepida]
MLRMLLLATAIILIMDTVIKYCNLCSHFDGYSCLGGMKTCWKLDMLRHKKTCTTEHFYFYDILTGAHIFRYSKLSCKPCALGLFQVYHDLLRETYCCTDKSYCNDGTNRLDMSSIYFQDRKEEEKKE